MTITALPASTAKLWLFVVLLMHTLRPITGERDLGWREEIAMSIVLVTDDEEEARLLTGIAFMESNFRGDVVSGRKRGPGGEVGAFQVAPKNKREAKKLADDRVYSARRALEEVRKSLEVCAHLTPKWQLSFYASGDGKCERARRHSAHRWAAAHREVPWVSN